MAMRTTIRGWIRGLSTAAAAAGVLALLALPPARGYSLLGGALRLDQRDVRVFDNFTDPEARDSDLKDPSFPGASGATLAIWKAAVEWGSEAHGDGLGDPSQFQIGSGGANFDFAWQGRAASVGGPSDNIVSEIGGSNFGVYAYCELPISDGWRIRFYADAGTWEDDPSVHNDFTRVDIQGVATHELGHALGLNHSTDITATMVGFLTGHGIFMRSIEADDVAGIRALYGSRAPDKPHVGGYELLEDRIVLRGSGFSPQGNAVWFTRRSASADGTPLVAAGLDSSRGGRRIELGLPLEATQGDVLVQRQGGGNTALSNAFPFDPHVAPCAAPVLYGRAKMNSQGALPELFLQGRASLTTGDFLIGTAGGIADQPGLLLSGAARAAVPFMGGTLWIASPLRREQAFQFDFVGGATIFPELRPDMIGTTRCYQIWFHDPGDGFGVGLSDAAEVTTCP